MTFFKRKKSQNEELAGFRVEHKAFLKSLPTDIREAAKHNINNREELSKSHLAGCYYCLSIFEPALIWEWISAANDEEFPMCPYCRIDSVYGDASGYPVTKDFLKQMNEYWFDGDGESVNVSVNDVLLRYGGKILGVRNYEAEKEEFAVSDFINLDKFYDFIWEVSTGEGDFTPAGVAFLNEYFDFISLANEFRMHKKQLPPQGEGRTEKKRIKLFVDYMNNIEPLETTLFIAESQWEQSGKKGIKPSLDNLDQRLLPPK